MRNGDVNVSIPNLRDGPRQELSRTGDQASHNSTLGPKCGVLAGPCWVPGLIWIEAWGPTETRFLLRGSPSSCFRLFMG